MVLLLIPVYYLSLTTPFRLIDDYTTWMIHGDLIKYLSFSSEGRSYPIYEYYNEITWSLFQTDYSLHHLTRLLVKILTFLLIFKLGKELCPLNVKKYEWSSFIFIFSLYFFYPNNPEARLAPQELLSAFFLFFTTYFIVNKQTYSKKIFIILIGFICFLLSKESNIIIGFLLFTFITYRIIKSSTHNYWIIPFVIVFTHTFINIYLITSKGGYGQANISLALISNNLSSLTEFILFPGGSYDPFILIFLLITPTYLIIKKTPSLVKNISLTGFWHDNKNIIFVTLLFVAAIATYSLSWHKVLRYAYLPTLLFHLLIYFSLRYILQNNLWSKLFSNMNFFSLIFVLIVFSNFYYQFFLQNFAGNFEKRLLNTIEIEANKNSIYLVDNSEYSHKILIYFTEFRDKYFPEKNKLKIARGKKIKGSLDYDFMLTRKENYVKKNIEKIGKNNIRIIEPTDDLLPCYHSFLMKVNQWVHLRNWIGKKHNYLWSDSGAQYPFKWHFVRNRK